jgi:hypothetical protein
MTTILGERLRAVRADEAGFSTAELLGNAALGIIALVAIWTVLQILGVDIVNWIRLQLIGG